VNDPSRSVVIAEVVLQSVGLSPLLLELSFTLLRWYEMHCLSFFPSTSISPVVHVADKALDLVDALAP